MDHLASPKVIDNYKGNDLSKYLNNVLPDCISAKFGVGYFFLSGLEEIIFGVSNQGVNYSPFARLYFTNPNTAEENLNWHIEADFELNMDLNGGHVNNVSRYHYHNIPTDYFNNDLNINGSSHSPLLGYAADGFPIYYKYLYSDPNDSMNGVSAFNSSFQLKSGSRPGDGITAPNGTYNGNYVEDYEYITGLSELDECGGRFGITPEYPDGIYYYVLTDNWPYIPRCLKGLYVDNSFKIGPNCPSSTAVTDCGTNILSIEDFAASEVVIILYPNPTSTNFNIKLNSILINEGMVRDLIRKIQIDIYAVTHYFYNLLTIIKESIILISRSHETYF